MSNPTPGSSTVSASVGASSQGPVPSAPAPAANPAPNTKRAGKERSQRSMNTRAVFKESGPTSVGISEMLANTADTPMSSIIRNRPTYIVPNFIQFFRVLAIMDQQMIHTKRFTDANHDWMPFVSQLYFSVLAYYFVLVCQKTAATISYEQLQFLDHMEETISVRHAKIPGPLVPFFQGLAAAAGPNEDFGNYTFAIPNNMEITQQNDYQAANDLHRNLPNIIFILDQFITWIVTASAAANAAPAVPHQAVDAFYTSIFGQAANNAAHTRRAMLTPSALNDIPMITSVVNQFVGSSTTWFNSLPFNNTNDGSIYEVGNDVTVLALDQILGFRGVGNAQNRSYDWFVQAGRIMQPYSDFFKDSASLGAVNTQGIGSIYIVTTYPHFQRNREMLSTDRTTRRVRNIAANAPHRYNIPDNTLQLYGRFSHPMEYLDTVTEQLGMLTQLHVTWSLLGGPVPGPTDENTRNGPITELPDYRARALTNLIYSIPNTVSGYYHSPAALKFE